MLACLPRCLCCASDRRMTMNDEGRAIYRKLFPVIALFVASGVVNITAEFLLLDAPRPAAIISGVATMAVGCLLLTRTQVAWIVANTLLYVWLAVTASITVLLTWVATSTSGWLEMLPSTLFFAVVSLIMALALKRLRILHRLLPGLPLSRSRQSLLVAVVLLPCPFTATHSVVESAGPGCGTRTR